MDRNDLIRALGGAFAEPQKEEDTSRSIVKTAVAGEKDVLRLFTSKDQEFQKYFYQNHPEATYVNNLVDELAKSGQKNIEIVGRELMVKFQKAVDEMDEARISQITNASKEMFLQLSSYPLGSQQKALGFMMVMDKIKAL